MDLDVEQMEVFANESSSAQIGWESSMPKFGGGGGVSNIAS